MKKWLFLGMISVMVAAQSAAASPFKFEEVELWRQSAALCTVDTKQNNRVMNAESLQAFANYITLETMDSDTVMCKEMIGYTTITDKDSNEYSLSLQPITGFRDKAACVEDATKKAKSATTGVSEMPKFGELFSTLLLVCYSEKTKVLTEPTKTLIKKSVKARKDV